MLCTGDSCVLDKRSEETDRRREAVCAHIGMNAKLRQWLLGDGGMLSQALRCAPVKGASPLEAPRSTGKKDLYFEERDSDSEELQVGSA